MRSMSPGVFVAACLIVGTAAAQTPTERQARSYVLSAFITGAAPAILNDRVTVTPQLRKRLALPEDAGRDRVYEALFSFTEEKAFRVRQPQADETRGLAPASAGEPYMTLEAPDLTVVMQYDLKQNNVLLVGLPVPAAAAGASASAEAKLVAVADAPSAQPAPRVPVTIRLTPVGFGFNKATLTDQAKAQLDAEGLPKLADIGAARYVVSGYADRLGPAQYNQRLSERRAQAMKTYLVAKGVDPANIQVLGFGATRAQTECSARLGRKALIECLAPDRRVTVEVEPLPL